MDMWGAARLAGTEFRGGDLTGEGQKGAPVHGLAWDLAQMLENGMRDALEHSERRCGTGRGVLTGEGGSAATDLVGVHVRTESRLESGCELVRARTWGRGMSILGSCRVLPCCRGSTTAEPWRTRRWSAGARLANNWSDLRAKYPSARERGGRGVLTEGRDPRKDRHRSFDGEIRRRRSELLAGEVVAGRLRASDPHE